MAKDENVLSVDYIISVLRMQCPVDIGSKVIEQYNYLIESRTHDE